MTQCHVCYRSLDISHLTWDMSVSSEKCLTRDITQTKRGWPHTKLASSKDVELWIEWEMPGRLRYFTCVPTTTSGCDLLPILQIVCLSLLLEKLKMYQEYRCAKTKQNNYNLDVPVMIIIRYSLQVL